MTGEKLKVLIWREWRLNRKSYLTGMCVGFIVTFFFWLFRLSISVGNFAPVFEDFDADVLADFDSMLYYMSVTLTAIVMQGLMLDVSILSADINANWLRYSFTLPITPALRTASHYCFKLIKLLCGFAFSILNGIVISKLTNMKFSGDMIWFMIVIVAAFVLYDTLMQYFLTQARTIKGIQTAQAKTLLTLTAVMIVAMYYKTFYKGDSGDGDMKLIIEGIRTGFLSHETIFIVLSLVSIFGGTALGCYITARHYRTYGDVIEKKERGTLFTLRKKDGDAA